MALPQKPGLGASALVDKIKSHAMATGYFDRTLGHEPKNRPGRGMTCAVWVDRIEPAVIRSGLSKTSVRITFNVRLYSSMISQNPDEIDPKMIDALDALMASYSNDFTLDGSIGFIDLLGITQGHPLMAQSGYITIDTMTMRVITITLPAVIHDVWTQNG